MLADEMGETLSEEFRKAFKRLVSLGWVKADDDARLIYLSGAVKHNMPESSNVIVGWASHFDEIPASPLKCEWLQGVRTLFEGNTGKDNSRLSALLKAFPNPSETLSEPFGKPFRTPDPDPDPDPDQDPEQEQDQDTEGGSGGEMTLEPSPSHEANLQRTIQLTLEEPSKTSRHEERDFAAFYAAYPKHEDKEDAKKAWKTTAGKRPPLEVILAAIEAQKKGDKWTRGFIKSPASWLRKGAWDDEVEPPRKPETDADRRRRMEDEDFKRGIAAVDEIAARLAKRAEEEAGDGD
jgi:hypothetical protein